MATGSTEPAGPPKAPGPDASRDEWRAWRHQQRDYMRSQMRMGGWFGAWPMWWGGWAGGWTWFWAVALILWGGYYLLKNLGLLDWIHNDVIWPILLIALGVFLLVRRRGMWL